MIVWLTGQPGSGKTTLARALEERGVVDRVLDGDDLRGICQEGFDYRGRHRNVERAQDIARWLERAGYAVCVALVSPYHAQREAFKREVDVLEVYLHTTKTRGKEDRFAEGYEPPRQGCLSLDTGVLSVEECVREIMGLLGHTERNVA